MTAVSLGTFINVNREELMIRCRTRALQIALPSTEREMNIGIPLFLDQLVLELGQPSSTTDIQQTAVEHGKALFRQGFSVTQVVHDYGNVCQSVVDLATELSVSISEHDVQILDRCLDDAIAGTVSEFSRQQQLLQTDQSFELITLVNEAIAAFDALQAGETGGTVAVVHRSLHRIRSRLEKLTRPLPAPLVTD
jgi:hypothetical protein